MTATALHLMLAASSFVVGEVGEACSLAIPVAPRPEDVVILAVATSERRWIEAEAELPEGRWPIAPEGLPEQVWGQVFQVVLRFGNLEEGGGGSLLIVPWEYNPACELRVWSDSSWVAEGDTVVFTLSGGLRAANRSSTYHALGWHSPYPTGELIQYDFRGSRDTPWVSAAQYFEMLSVLPLSAERGPGSFDALSEFREWAEWRSLESRFPISGIIRSWERAARGGG